MILAYLAAIVVLVIPGATVALIAGMPFRSLRTWAAIPALSLALVFVIAELTLVTGVAFGALTVSIVVAVLAAAAVVLRQERDPLRRAEVAHSWEDADVDAEIDVGVANKDRAGTIAHTLLGLGVVIGLVTWAHGIAGHGLVPPSSDGAYHGFFVARIMETHSIDVAKIAVSDPAGHFPLVSYYPFAMHALAAVGAQLTGADIGRLLVAFTVLFSAVILPLGMFVLARMLAPRSPLIAGFTALFVPSVALFPYAPIQFGDIPIVVGMAVVPIAVVLVTAAIASPDSEPRLPIRQIIIAALAVLAIVGVHSSQLPLTIALVALLVVERSVRAASTQLFTRAVVRALTVSAVAVVLFAPSLRSFASGVSERSGFDNTPIQSLHRIIGPTLALDPGFFGHPTRQTLLAIVAAVGVLVWLLSGRFAWVVGFVLVVAVMLFAAVSDSGLSRALSLPWYRGPARIGWNRVFFVPFFAGVTAAYAVAAVVRRRKYAGAALVVSSIAAVAIFGVMIGYRGYDTSSAMLRDSFSHNALVTSESEAAFAWLDRHAQPRDTIVNDVNALGITTDDSVWMYAQRRLTPLFGYAQVTSSGFAPPDRATRQDQRDRLYLLNHLQLLDRNRRVQDLARRYRVRWVYFDRRSITVFRNTLDLAELSKNPQLRSVFHRGPVHVFELEPLPSP